MSKLSPEAQVRTQALNRLNPSARQVYDRCLKRHNQVEASQLRSVYEFSADLVLVRSNSDTYGAAGLEDLAAAIGLSDRQTSKYLMISKTISPEEMKNYENAQAADGRVFTATHLMILCGLSSVADRRKAFKQWQVNSMKSAELEEYVKDLNNAAKADEEDDEDGETSSAPPTTIRVLQRLNTSATKALEAVADLEAVDLGTFVMTLSGKSVDLMPKLTASLTKLSSQAPLLLERINKRPPVNPAVLTGGLNSLKPTQPVATATAVKPPKVAAPKKASPKKAPAAAVKKAPVKKVASPVPKKVAPKKPEVSKPKVAKPKADFAPAETVTQSVKSNLADSSPAASRRARGK